MFGVPELTNTSTSDCKSPKLRIAGRAEDLRTFGLQAFRRPKSQQKEVPLNTHMRSRFCQVLIVGPFDPEQNSGLILGAT